MVILSRAVSYQLSAQKIQFETLERLMPMPHRGDVYSSCYLWLAQDCVASGAVRPGPRADD
jgi:hypothetical protein